jgi:hypothetical protein
VFVVVCLLLVVVCCSLLLFVVAVCCCLLEHCDYTQKISLAIGTNLPGIIYSITHARSNPCILILVQDDKFLNINPDPGRLYQA